MHTHAHPYPSHGPSHGRDSRVLAHGPELSEPHDLYHPARRHWPGILAAAVIAAVVALLAVNEPDHADTAPPPVVTQPSTPARSDAVAPGSERPAVGDIEDTSGVIVTDQQPVDVSSPASEETAPAQ